MMFKETLTLHQQVSTKWLHIFARRPRHVSAQSFKDPGLFPHAEIKDVSRRFRVFKWEVILVWSCGTVRDVQRLMLGKETSTNAMQIFCEHYAARRIIVGSHCHHPCAEPSKIEARNISGSLLHAPMVDPFRI